MENYFILESENNDNYPLFEFKKSEDDTLFMENKVISLNKPVQLTVGDPKQKKPLFVDYHQMPVPVFSEKIKTALEAMNIHGIQLIDAELRFKGKLFPYCVLHVMNGTAVPVLIENRITWSVI